MRPNESARADTMKLERLWTGMWVKYEKFVIMTLREKLGNSGVWQMDIMVNHTEDMPVLTKREEHEKLYEMALTYLDLIAKKYLNGSAEIRDMEDPTWRVVYDPEVALSARASVGAG